MITDSHMHVFPIYVYIMLGNSPHNVANEESKCSL
jgi:hypothetical protein